MKNIFLILIIFFALLFFSCDVPFNPDAQFRQRYVLSGIMRSDTNIQIVTLSKSYRPTDGFNPLSNTQDPFVAGAEINIRYRDTLYELRDSTIARIDTSHYKDSVHFYYTKNLRPQTGEYVDIEALLPNGILLQATTHLPAIPQFDFFDYNDDRIIPPLNGGDSIIIRWQPIPGVYFLPRIVIEYYVKGSTIAQEKVVPLYYYEQGGNTFPIYPIETQTNSFLVGLEIINRALNEIPQNGLDKSNYSIAGIDVQMIIFDQDLGTYYFSLQENVDAFTVKLDQPDYSNVQGGYGIFGSYVRTDFYIKFSAQYLAALGYY